MLQYLYKKKRFPKRKGGARGSSFREKMDEPKVCLNYKKPLKFVAKCLELHKERPNKENSTKDA